ncbi:MAG: hypothetical protein JXR60_10500 [Bacteroidales bacterium]|nr:hypothetical protein [Bacteroidales bacterium]
MDLKIKDVKDIIAFVDEHFHFDFSGFTYVSFKIKLEQYFQKFQISNLNNLFSRLESSVLAEQEFLTFVMNNEVELFRDPAFWRIIKEEVLKKNNLDIGYRVCIPSCYQGAELISFLIIRDVLGLTQQVNVIYTAQLDLLNLVNKGFEYDERKHNLNLSNFKRIDGLDLPEKYLERKNNRIFATSQLFENTTFQKFDETNELLLRKCHLIIYRNRLLNYNKQYQVKVMNNLIGSLKPAGYIALGVKEIMVDDNNREQFQVINKKESIYKKRI